MALVVSVALLGGCSSATQRTQPSPVANAMGMCEGLSATMGERVASCRGGIFSGLSGSVTAATMVYENLLNCPGFLEAQKSGRLTYDAVKGQACLDALAAMSCGQLDAMNGLPDPCAGALVGNVPVGEACFLQSGLECASGACSFSGANSCLTGGTCDATAGLGEDCTSLPCKNGLRCLAGLCEADLVSVVGVGGDCGDNNVSVCDDTSWCDGSSMRCVARKAATVACGETGECQAGLRCLGAPGAMVCEAPLALGATCVAGEAKCAPDTYCGAAGKCVGFPTVGGDCTPVVGETVLCLDAWCPLQADPSSSVACQPPQAAGEFCSYNLEEAGCAAGYTCIPFDRDIGICGKYYCMGK
jgi:hypothetical protein